MGRPGGQEDGEHCGIAFNRRLPPVSTAPCTGESVRAKTTVAFATTETFAIAVVVWPHKEAATAMFPTPGFPPATKFTALQVVEFRRPIPEPRTHV
jgi:hypothetical protein